MTYSIGQSKVKTWRNCRQAYWYKYEEEIIPKRTVRPFVFGSLIHRMIEANAQGLDPMQVIDDVDLTTQSLFTAEVEMYGDILADIRTIMSDYFAHWVVNGKDPLRFLPVKDETGEMRFAEHEFAIPLDELVANRVVKRSVAGIVFNGQVDGLAKTQNGLRWLVENKSFDKLPPEDERWRNLQFVVYVRAALHMRWVKSIDGVAWNYVCSKPPTIPEVLKSGKRLSVREIVTLPSVVYEALRKHGLRADDPDHEKLLERATQSRDHYFQRIFTPVNEAVAENLFAGFVESAIEMRDHHLTRRDKNVGRHCSWCSYEPLCRAELTGGDVDYVKDREFVKEDSEGYRRTKRSPNLKVVR